MRVLICHLLIFLQWAWRLHADIIPSINGLKFHCSSLEKIKQFIARFTSVFVSSTQSPAICDKVEQICYLLSVVCSTIICKHLRITVVSVYHSPTVCIDESRSVL